MNRAAILLGGPSHELAAAVPRREISAAAVVEGSIDRIDATDGRVNDFLQLTLQRALAEAAALDARLVAGDSVARLLQRMTASGAVLVGALNMDEYAYGFTTKTRTTGRPAIRTTWHALRVAPRAARPLRWPRARCH